MINQGATDVSCSIEAPNEDKEARFKFLALPLHYLWAPDGYVKINPLNIPPIIGPTDS